MANLLSYVLDHDECTFYITKENDFCLEKIYKKSDVGIKKMTDKKYFDYKISFDNFSFSDEFEEKKNKIIEIIKDIKDVKIDSSYTKKIELKKIRELKSNSDELEIYIDEENKIILKKRYYRETKLDGCLISLHMNEIHPHIHLILPKKGSWGKNFYTLKKELFKIMLKYNTPSSDMYQNFPPEYLKDNEFKEKYSRFKTARAILSAISWTFEKERNKTEISRKKEKLFAKKYLVDFVALEHLNYKNKYNVLRKKYSFKKLLEDYLYFENYGGTRTFIKKLFNENKELLRLYSTIKLEDFKSEKEEKAKKLLEEKDYIKIINNVIKDILNVKKIPIAYREFVNEKKDSKDKLEQIIRKGIKKILQERKLKDSFGINEKERKKNLNLKVKEISKEYNEYLKQNKEVLEILKDYKEFLQVEINAEKNIFKKLEEKYPKCNISKIRGEKQNIKINGEEKECSNIFNELEVETRYQKIYKNIISEIENIKIDNPRNKKYYNQELEVIGKIILKEIYEKNEEDYEEQNINFFDIKEGIKETKKYLEIENKNIYVELNEIIENLFIKLNKVFINIPIKIENVVGKTVTKVENNFLYKKSKEIKGKLDMVNDIKNYFDLEIQNLTKEEVEEVLLKACEERDLKKIDKIIENLNYLKKSENIYRITELN